MLVALRWLYIGFFPQVLCLSRQIRKARCQEHISAHESPGSVNDPLRSASKQKINPITRRRGWIGTHKLVKSKPGINHLDADIFTAWTHIQGLTACSRTSSPREHETWNNHLYTNIFTTWSKSVNHMFRDIFPTWTQSQGLTTWIRISSPREHKARE